MVFDWQSKHGSKHDGLVQSCFQDFASSITFEKKPEFQSQKFYRMGVERFVGYNQALSDQESKIKQELGRRGT